MPVAETGRIGVNMTVTVVLGSNSFVTGRYAGCPPTEYRNDEGTGLSCQFRSELPSEISYSKSTGSGRGMFETKLNCEIARITISSDEGGSQRPAVGPAVSRHAACSASATNGPSWDTVKVPG